MKKLQYVGLADCFDSISTDPNYLAMCDIETEDSPNEIDICDIVEFADNWLWKADWLSSRYATEQPAEVMQEVMMFMPLSMFSISELLAEEKLEIVEEAEAIKETQYLLEMLPEFDGKDDAIELLDSRLELLEGEYNPFGDGL